MNTTIHLISDAHLDAYDNFYLVSADSDQVATVKLFRQQFPHKEIILVAPPGMAHSKDALAYANGHRTIYRETIAKCLLGATVLKGGRPHVQRPKEYTPPGSGLRR